MRFEVVSTLFNKWANAIRVCAACLGRHLVPVAMLLMMLPTLGGCVRRTLRITTDPPHALVVLNDQEIGRSDVSTDFLWYGDYDVVIRKEGYETISTNWRIQRPWYQMIPLDFFFEVLWPGMLHDVHARHFVLEPASPPAPEELVERAVELREEAVTLLP